MKMTKEDYSKLELSIKEVLTRNPDAVEGYQKGHFARSEKVKDLQKRFCWDCYHAIKNRIETTDRLYKNLNDSHVYTALKMLCPTVTRQY